jgi:hypothetical protein
VCELVLQIVVGLNSFFIFISEVRIRLLTGSYLESQFLNSILNSEEK